MNEFPQAKLTRDYLPPICLCVASFWCLFKVFFIYFGVDYCFAAVDMAGDERLDTCTVRDASIYISIKGKQLDGMQRFLFAFLF